MCVCVCKALLLLHSHLFTWNAEILKNNNNNNNKKATRVSQCEREYSSEDMVNVYSAHVLGHDSLFLSLSLNSSKRTKGTFTSGQDDHSVVEAQLEKRS
jgi:hypothetical protein